MSPDTLSSWHSRWASGDTTGLPACHPVNAVKLDIDNNGKTTAPKFKTLNVECDMYLKVHWNHETLKHSLNCGTLGKRRCLWVKLGGGFKYFSFPPLLGEMIQFDYYFSDGLKPPTRKIYKVGHVTRLISGLFHPSYPFCFGQFIGGISLFTTGRGPHCRFLMNLLAACSMG